MAFSYKPLWKMLIDRDMTKKQFSEKTGISKSTIEKLSQGKNVSMDIVDRICTFFDCEISEVVEHINEEKMEK